MRGVHTGHEAGEDGDEGSKLGAEHVDEAVVTR